MIFSINRIFFINELTKNNRIIDQKAFIPSHSGIKFEVTEEKVSLISYKNTVTFKTVITDSNKSDLKIKQIGECLIKGKYLLEILRRMEDEIISLSCVETNLLRINGDNKEFNINIMDYSSFPLVGFKQVGKSINVKSSELKKSLQQTIISVNEENQKLIFTGLNFKVSDNFLNIIGTDGFRISRKKIKIDNYEEEGNLETNIPFKNINELIKLLDIDTNIKIIFNETTVTFIIGNSILQTNILEGKFPNIDFISENDFNTVIFVKNDTFQKIISRADIPSEEYKGALVNLLLDGDVIHIKSYILNVGNFEETFTNFEIKGIDEQNISVNSKYLIESLKSFNTNVININLINSTSPIIISSDEEKNLLHIIMPMTNINIG